MPKAKKKEPKNSDFIQCNDGTYRHFNEGERDWSFTLNNYTEADCKMWERLAEESAMCFISKEIAPTTGTPHLQGRIVFRRNYRFTQWKKQEWADHFEWTKARSDICYMIKKDSVIFIDKKKNQGKRSDLQDCIDSAAGGASKRKLFTDFGPTMVRYGRGIAEATKALKAPEPLANYTLADFPNWTPITDFTKSPIICGGAGLGKTEFALAHFKNALLVSEIDQLLDFDPDEHDGIVFDDMDFTDSGPKMNQGRSQQIAVTDNAMPRAVRCRYRSPVIPRGTKKIFTCNNWCVDVDDPAIARRIQQVLAFNRSQNLKFHSCDRSGP